MWRWLFQAISIRLVLRPCESAITARHWMCGERSRNATFSRRDSWALMPGLRSLSAADSSLPCAAPTEADRTPSSWAFSGTVCSSCSASSFSSTSLECVGGKARVASVCRPMTATPRTTTMPIRSWTCRTCDRCRPHFPVSMLKNFPLMVCPTCERQPHLRVPCQPGIRCRNQGEPLEAHVCAYSKERIQHWSLFYCGQLIC